MRCQARSPGTYRPGGCPYDKSKHRAPQNPQLLRLNSYNYGGLLADSKCEVAGLVGIECEGWFLDALTLPFDCSLLNQTFGFGTRRSEPRSHD